MIKEKFDTENIKMQSEMFADYNKGIVIKDLMVKYEATRHEINKAIDIIKDKIKAVSMDEKFAEFTNSHFYTRQNFILCTNNSEVLKAYQLMTGQKYISNQNQTK